MAHKKDVVIVGARGYGKEVISFLEEDGGWNIVALLDELDIAELLGYPVIRPESYDGRCKAAILAVGFPHHKVAIVEKYRRFGFEWQRHVDRRAYVSRHATIGAGSIIEPFAVVYGDASVGTFVTIKCFTGCGHDTVIGDYATLLPLVGMGGDARIGERCLLSMGCHISPGVTLGADCRVAPGAVVKRDAPPGHILLGNPARARRNPRLAR